MAQHDAFQLGNVSGAEFRAALNLMLLALASGNSGATAPSVTYAGMPWVDTSNGDTRLRVRNAADDDWDLVATGVTGNGQDLVRQGTKAQMRTFLALGAAALLGAPDNDDLSVSDADVCLRKNAKAYADQVQGVVQSAEITLANDTLASAAHGLGVVPSQTWSVLRCKTAEYGYSVGDEVAWRYQDNVNSGPPPISADDTNIYCPIGDGLHQVVRRTAGSNADFVNITAANWRLVLRARV